MSLKYVNQQGISLILEISIVFAERYKSLRRFTRKTNAPLLSWRFFIACLLAAVTEEANRILMISYSAMFSRTSIKVSQPLLFGSYRIFRDGYHPNLEIFLDFETGADIHVLISLSLNGRFYFFQSLLFAVLIRDLLL